MHWTTDRPLTHPGARKLVSELVRGFSGDVFIRQPRPIVFVCGGALISHQIFLRKLFLDWAKANLGSKANFLLSEDAYASALQAGSRFINLSEFEQVIASLSDCILVFPESAGSFSEVGIFATRPEICKKTLIANDAAHYDKDSFLMLGPLHAIDKDSLYTPAVTFRSSGGPDDTFWRNIWGRIEGRYKPQIRRRRIDVSHFVQLDLRQRMSLVFAILRITGIAKFGDILDIVRQIYPNASLDIPLLKETLSALKALNQIDEPADELYFPNTNADFDLDLKLITTRLEAKFRLFWMNEFPQLWKYTR